jgi:transcriptional regulator with XRE-family HTH domain
MRSKESAPGPKRDGPARKTDTGRTVGAKIRELRQARGWTQEEFAHRSGLHRADVGAIERGERNVTLRTMRTVADTLGVRIADLTEGL